MSKEIINISVDVLKVHPRNTEFFDDITGDNYERFKKTIKEDGVGSPILVSPDMTIVSGHQRYKACKDLGIKLVPIIIDENLIDEDTKLKKLLVMNFGREKNDDNKQRKVAVEYVNLCGNTHGGVRSSSDNQNLLSQEQIAKHLNVSVSVLNEMLAIERKLTPEIKELLENGIFTKTTASKLLTKLSPQEQEELILQLDTTKKYTQKQIQEYIEHNQQLQQQITELENQPPKVVEKEKIIDKTDYTLSNKNKQLQENIDKITREKQQLEEINKGLSKSKQLADELNKKYEVQVNEYMKVKSKILDLNLDPNGEYNLYTVMSEVEKLTTDIEDLLVNKLAPIRYKTTLQVVKNSDLKNNFANIISMVSEWCSDMANYIGIEIKNNEFDNFIEIESEDK